MNLNKKIKNLLNSLNAPKLNLRKIYDDMKTIYNYKEVENYDYLNALLEPEKIKGVRLPSEIPVPSTTFQLRNVEMLYPNDDGVFLARMNPFFLSLDNSGAESPVYFGSKSGNTTYYRKEFALCYFSSFFRCVGPFLDGKNHNAYNYWASEFDREHYALRNPNLSYQMIPDNVYESYRLVSASVRLKYIGALDEVSGVIGGGISFQNDQRLGCSKYRVAFTNLNAPPEYSEGRAWSTGARIEYALLDEFDNFNNIRDLTYSCENNALDGLRMLYFPVSNKDEQFYKVLSKEHLQFVYNKPPNLTSEIEFKSVSADQNHMNTDFWWLMYGEGLPPDSKVLMEYFCNFECIPCAEFLNFCPVETRPYAIDPIKKKQVLDEVKKYAVGKYK